MTKIGPFTFDPGQPWADAFRVTLRGMTAMLDAREFDLLETFASARGVVTYGELRELTGANTDKQARQRVVSLREKIELAWDFAYTIDCESGEGYALRKIEKPEWLEVRE